MRCSGQCQSARATRLRRAPYSARRPPRCGRPCRGSCSRPSRASSRLRRVVWRRAWLRRGASPPGASRAPGARRGALGTCPAALMSSTARARCPRCSWAVRARKRRALPAGGGRHVCHAVAPRARAQKAGSRRSLGRGRPARSSRVACGEGPAHRLGSKTSPRSRQRCCYPRRQSVCDVGGHGHRRH